MKSCTKCNELKSFDGFTIRRTRKGMIARHTWCKDCHNAYKRQNVLKKTYELKKYVSDLLLNSKCEICNISDFYALEFNHKIPSDKSFEIAQAISGNRIQVSLEQLKSEIAKCEIVCANCHKRKTAEQLRTWRWRYMTEGNYA